jgi:hypothetical protein
VQAGALAWHWVARLLTGPPRSPVPPRQARPCTHARTPPRPRTPITRALPRVTGKGGRALPLTLYLAQLGLNLAWTPLFFQKHWSDAALADSVGAWRRCAACSCVCGAATPPCSHSLFCHGHTQPDTPLPPTHTRAHTHTHTHTHTHAHTRTPTPRQPCWAWPRRRPSRWLTRPAARCGARARARGARCCGGWAPRVVAPARQWCARHTLPLDATSIAFARHVATPQRLTPRVRQTHSAQQHTPCTADFDFLPTPRGTRHQVIYPLMVPYLMWVTFATALTGEVWRLNPDVSALGAREGRVCVCVGGGACGRAWWCRALRRVCA